MDTVTILKTMRAVVADVEPRYFNMSVWFDHDKNCGCIIGLSVRMQQHLAAALNIAVSPEPSNSRGWLLVRGRETSVYHGVYDEIAQVTGLNPTDARFLFSADDYPNSALRGNAGKAEAMRRLDEIIAKYTPSGTDTRAEPRPLAQTA